MQSGLPRIRARVPYDHRAWLLHLARLQRKLALPFRRTRTFLERRRQQSSAVKRGGSPKRFRDASAVVSLKTGKFDATENRPSRAPSHLGPHAWLRELVRLSPARLQQQKPRTNGNP